MPAGGKDTRYASSGRAAGGAGTGGRSAGSARGGAPRTTKRPPLDLSKPSTAAKNTGGAKPRTTSKPTAKPKTAPEGPKKPVKSTTTAKPAKPKPAKPKPAKPTVPNKGPKRGTPEWYTEQRALAKAATPVKPRISNKKLAALIAASVGGAGLVYANRWDR